LALSSSSSNRASKHICTLNKPINSATNNGTTIIIWIFMHHLPHLLVKVKQKKKKGGNRLLDSCFRRNIRGSEM
jgi:hypothetical protein